VGAKQRASECVGYASGSLSSTPASNPVRYDASPGRKSCTHVVPQSSHDVRSYYHCWTWHWQRRSSTDLIVPRLAPVRLGGTTYVNGRNATRNIPLY
jgi:hypothetical protein